VNATSVNTIKHCTGYTVQPINTSRRQTSYTYNTFSY